MFIETQTGILQAELLSGEPDIVHAYTSRVMDDMRKVEPRHDLKKRLGISTFRLVGAEQTHGAEVHVVGEKDLGQTVPSVDGLVARVKDLSQRPLLCIITADCVPLLFADTHAGVVGAAHAGWKGTLAGIAKHVVKAMTELGSKPSDIRVGIGPHIRSCCYNVDMDRVKAFETAFYGERVVFARDARQYLDLEQANRQTLVESGILSEHIDASRVCTASNPHVFYSYRNTIQPYGEQIAVIGLT